jgi:hypothetical protein
MVLGFYGVYQHLSTPLCCPTGLQQLWSSGSWKELVGPDGLSSSSSPVLQCSAVDAAAMSAPGAGVKRGLLEALLQLSMPQEVRGLAVQLTTTTVDLPILAVRAP